MTRVESKSREDIQAKMGENTIDLKELEFETKKAGRHGTLKDIRGKFKGWVGGNVEANGICDQLSDEWFDIKLNKEIRTSFGIVCGFE
jgi:hypothetical protein